MSKLISSINITLDGFCDHTAVIADEQLHQHYNKLLKSIDIIIFGRVTYQLMESGWAPIVKNPTGNQSMDEFAVLIEDIPKIVFSRTLESVQWRNTTLVKDNLKDEVLKLKQEPNKNILVGSPSLIQQLMSMNLIDEYQFCINPIIFGGGLPLFKHIKEKINLQLIKTKTFDSGVVAVSYELKK